MPEIKIKHGDAETGKLTLDPVELKAGKTEHVTWQLEKGCLVEYIISIEAKPSNPNIWSEKPKRDGNSTNWQGRINESPDYAEWNYNIKWRATDGTLPPVFDPKILVNSTEK